MKLVRLYYPWPSTLGAAAVIAWQFALLNPIWLETRELPQFLLRQENLYVGFVLSLLVIAFDIWLFFKKSRLSRRQLQRYRDQIGELFDSKRKLGTRARTYSDHADKLKMFISERLLEYIEYDEKFLHFKNIAAEVRHNGVISYDKTQTALKKAQTQCDPGEQQQFREASDSLLYLWDLLDLSTTDNIALHVTNQIYDCEEHYFQALLNDGDIEPAPFEPTFLLSQALRRALLPVTDNPDELGLNAWKCPGRYHDGKFTIQLLAELEVLGNVNHMVLLIENLINNALFYAQKKGHKSLHSRVVIFLNQFDAAVEFRIYNRGPHINEEERSKIYQLGFSSRRIREHHGKGLGLYFVDQIVRGFEASIDFENVENCGDKLTLCIRCANNATATHTLLLEIVNGKPMCRQVDVDDTPAKRCEWSLAAAITSIEVTSAVSASPHVLADISANATSLHFDSNELLRPRWLLEIKNQRRSAKLVFEPLDARGVEFIARFPSAKSRLESQT